MGRSNRVRSIPAGEFKAHCLRIMDEVRDTRAEVVITKHGRPVAKLVPVDEEMVDSYGALRGTVVYHDDIVAPDHESWEDGA
jgi:prevent-host-death family protein